MTPAVSDPRTYFEDVSVAMGAIETPGITITDAHVALFVGAGDAPSGGGLVPDLLVLCVSSGLGWRVPGPPLAVLALMGIEWRFHVPVRIGDTIRNRARSVAKRSMRDGGVVIEERQIVNQRGEVVQSGRITILVAKRPAG
jgi:acyl dehydratase